MVIDTGYDQQGNIKEDMEPIVRAQLQASRICIMH